MILVGVRAMSAQALARAGAPAAPAFAPPDLSAELAYWQEQLKLRDWRIEIAYVDGLRNPDTGADVWGLCWREPDNRTARIEIRTPRSESDCAETYDTIVHELLHCLQAAAGAPMVVEEQIVWTLAPLLTQLRLAQPARARALARALAQTKTKLGAQVGARAGGTGMDPEKIKAIIAALKEGNGEAALTLLEGLLTDAVASPAAAPATEPPAATEAKEGDPPAPPPMGVAKDPQQPCKDAEYKKLEEQLASDRAAAVDGLLDTRPDLSAAQRTRMRVIGLQEGVGALRKDLQELVPPPAKTELQEPAARAKLGLEKAPRGGSGGSAKAMSSGNPKIQALFRVMNRDPENDGVEIPSDGTALVRFSVVDSWAKVKFLALQRRDADRAKAAGVK